MTFNQKGFTVIELLIVTVATTLLTITLVAFMFNFWRFSYYSQANQNSFVERLNTSDYLRERLSASSGLITQNGIPDSNVGFADPVDASGNYWVPVHAIPGNINTTTAGDINPIIYFKSFSAAADGSLIMNGLIPFEDEYVVYLTDSKELKVRVLANPNTLATNRLKTTCPPATANAACPEDTVLINDVESVDRRYFSRSGNLIDWTSVYDSDIAQYIGPDNGAVEVVELKINVSAKAAFQKSETLQNSTIVRVALRNT
jgi:type II secretory pathway pseudopilin PulG